MSVNIKEFVIYICMCVCVVLFLSTAILCNDAWALQVGCCLMVFNEVKV